MKDQEWVVRKTARALESGDRFIFSEKLGGEGQTVTVDTTVDNFGTVLIYTEELDYTLDVTDTTWVELAP